MEASKQAKDLIIATRPLYTEKVKLWNGDDYIGYCHRISVNDNLRKVDKLSKKESIVLNAYATASIDSAQKVIFEDREILELIQQNMEIIPKLSQIFGEEEFRIKLFHDKITELINYK